MSPTVAAARVSTPITPTIDLSACTRCNHCLAICHQEAVVETASAACAKCVKYCTAIESVRCNLRNLEIDPERCDGCGRCVEECPEKAISR